MLTCIHSLAGLCRACQDEYDTDPAAFIEFGNHPEGIARWQGLLAEIAADADRPEGPPWPDSAEEISW